MNELESLIHDQLDRIFPEVPAFEQWDDVLARAQPVAPPRRRLSVRRTRAALVAVAVLAAAAVAAVVVPHGGGMSFTDRALAALGNGPVLHAVVRPASAPGELLQLSTGRTRRHVFETEYWYQARPRRLAIHTVRDGKVIEEIVNTATVGLSSTGARSKPGGYRLVPDAALADFLTGYRPALANHRARITGHGTIGGRPVTYLSIAARVPKWTDVVAIDSATHRPLRFRLVDRADPRIDEAWENVALIETVPLRPSLFAAPKVVLQLAGGHVVDSTVVSAAQATRALGAPALLPGPALGAVRLQTIKVQHLREGYPRADHKAPIDGRGLELRYGHLIPNDRLDWTRPYVEITEAATPQMGQMFPGDSAGGPLDRLSNPVPSEGWMDVISAGLPMWIGQLRTHGMYVTVQASSRALLLEAARRLVAG